MTKAKIERQGESGFQVSGDMTFETASRLLKESKALLQDVEDLNLDLAEVEHVDSAGLALLLEWVVQIKKKGGEISLNGIPDSLLAIARLCQLHSTLEPLTTKNVHR
jgi:phospholipid transport system transporter-binding protein